MTDYFVDVNASLEEEFGSIFINTFSVTGTGAALSSSSPLQLNAGDRVGFRKVVTSPGGSVPSNSGLASGFNSNHWTNTNNIVLSSSYQYKTVKSGISISVTDEVTCSISAGFSSRNDKTYYIGASVNPDLSVVVSNSSIEIATTDTSFTQTISNETGTSTDNASITEYRIKDAGSSHESRTNYGSITVTDVPSNPGFPKNYSVEARVTTANGGSGVFRDVPGSTFSVLATTTATSNDPSIEPYGVAIFDHNENIVTSFTEGHTVLRKIFSSSSAVTLSTTTHTDVDTGLTGITTSNCVIELEAEDGGTNANGGTMVPATFVTGGNGNIHVRIARVPSAIDVNVEVLQYKGLTIGAASETYGMIIKNGENDAVIDESSEVFSVREVIDLAPTGSNFILQQNDETYFLYVTLTQGRYMPSDGLPVPALSCSNSVLLLPPILFGTTHTDGSYKRVLVTIPKPATITNFKLAMLIPGSGSPEYYGGSASDYGLVFRNASGNTIWRSDHRQAIVNNIIPCNQMSGGTNQNGNYDVTSGEDGVLAPVLTQSNTEFSLVSRDTTKSLTGLNEMDPANSFVAGSMTSMYVDYYKGHLYDLEFGLDEAAGGGKHLLGIRISSTNTATLGTYRYREGSNPPTSSDYGTRNPESYHPEGNFVIFRII